VYFVSLVFFPIYEYDAIDLSETNIFEKCSSEKINMHMAIIINKPLSRRN
jgi:hypothetical protein